MLRAENFTQILESIRQGDHASADVLMEAVYDDLRRVAGRYMASERPEHTLQPTAIINEVFLRMFRPVDARPGDWEPAAVDWQSRAHFLGIAARQMRQVLIDHARQKRAAKRNFGIRIEMSDAERGVMPEIVEHDFELLDRLLELLAAKDPEAARVVELKFFGGLSDKEAALVMGINIPRLRRDWEFARTWLRQRMPRCSKN